MLNSAHVKLVGSGTNHHDKVAEFLHEAPVKRHRRVFGPNDVKVGEQFVKESTEDTP